MNDRLAVEYVAVADLVAYERNPRAHSKEQIAQLAAMIREVGFLVPVLLDDMGVLIAGHGRREAALLLGMTEVPAIRAAHLTPAQVKAMRLADNQLTLASSYNLEALSAEVNSLAKEGFNLKALGFSDDYLEAVIKDNRKALEETQRAHDQAQMRKPAAPAETPPSGGGTGGDPGEDRYKSQYGVIVLCAGEAEQQKVYEQLKSEGLQVRVVVT